MSSEKTHTEIDLVSRLGCMRRNTVIKDSNMGSIEHIELWVPHESEAMPMATRKRHRKTQTKADR